MYLKIFWTILLIQSDLFHAYSFDAKFNETADFILQEVNPENIGKNLRHLTQKQHLAGTPAEKETADWLANEWKQQGLDEVHVVPYEVLLSYPIKGKHNIVTLYDPSGIAVWESQGVTPALKSPEEENPDILKDFNAYSPSGNVKEEIIYANFGQEEDFDQLLNELHVNVSGKIVIAKYGKVFRGNIVSSAEKRGAAGVLLYPDPQQYAEEGTDLVYPDTIFIPGSAAPMGTVYMEDGDPLTRFYPSIESAFRIPEEEAAVPKIPVMPMGYNDAWKILSKMGGNPAPAEWQGSLNITYNLGPGLAESGWQVGMEVNMVNERRNTYNVIGVLKGAVEPDRYVLLGNHRDAWIFGASDPSSGTAAMVELSRTLTEATKQKGWRPRRSIVFCSWGAEEYGLIGSQEWVENFAAQLVDRAVLYINVDVAVNGNISLNAESVPMLNEIAKEISKLVPNPNPDEVALGRRTVYDSWLSNYPDEKNMNEPQIELLGSGSDYKSFVHKYGISAVDYHYMNSKNISHQPLYHTLYETYYSMAELYDKGFHTNAAIAQLWGLLATYVAEAEILPFDVNTYAVFIEDAQKNLMKQTGELLVGREEAIGYFTGAADEFKTAAQTFTQSLAQIDTSDALAVRRINDQLMQVERSFIDRRGLPGRPDYNHVAMAPSVSDSYSASAFSGLTDALSGIDELHGEEQSQRWRRFDEHMAACTYFIISATKTLNEQLW